MLRETDALLRDLGISLLTGAFFTLAVFALQLVNDVNTQEESFRLTVALSNDLSGFTTDRESLAGMYLNSKTLDGADLRGKDLSGIKLRNAKPAAISTLLPPLITPSTTSSSRPGTPARRSTCWPRTFVNNKKVGLERAGVVKMPTRTHDGGQVEPSRGHACEVNEHDQAGVGY